MFKDILKLILLFILFLPILAFSAPDKNGLNNLEKFFEKNHYRQIDEVRALKKQIDSQIGDDFKLQAVRDFYLKIKKNKRFKADVKKDVLAKTKSFYQFLKIKQNKELLAAKDKTQRPTLKPINLRPIHIKAEPIVTITPSSENLWRKNLITVNFIILAIFSGIIFLLFRKNVLLQKENSSSNSLVEEGFVAKVLDNTILNNLLKFSTAILPQNSYVLFDFSGKVSRFSANMKTLVAGNIKAGMKWKDILERHFHKIGEGESSYYISLHNTEKFFSANTKSIEALKLNICQLVEVDKEMVTQTVDYQNHYYLETPCSLVDLFENALVDTSSFRDFNLVDNVLVESAGNDVSFQAEKDIENLFLSMGQVIKYVYEDEAPFAKVHFDTFKERHIINLEFINYQFASLNDPNSKEFCQKIEEIKQYLSELGGSIVVKNINNGLQDSAVIQVIFDQVTQRDISIDEEFELQVL